MSTYCESRYVLDVDDIQSYRPIHVGPKRILNIGVETLQSNEFKYSNRISYQPPDQLAVPLGSANAVAKENKKPKVNGASVVAPTSAVVSTTSNGVKATSPKILDYKQALISQTASPKSNGVSTSNGLFFILTSCLLCSFLGQQSTHADNDFKIVKARKKEHAAPPTSSSEYG